MDNQADKPMAPAINLHSAHAVADYVANFLEKEQKATQPENIESSKGQEEPIEQQEKPKQNVKENSKEIEEAEEESEEIGETEFDENETDIEEEDEEDSESEEDEPVFSMELDGKEVEVSLSELLSEYAGKAKREKANAQFEQEKAELAKARLTISKIAPMDPREMISVDPLLTKMAGINMERAAKEHPDLVAQLMPEIQRRQERIHNLYAEHQAQIEKIREATDQQEKARFIELFPEYQDEEKYDQFEDEFMPMLEEFDFSDEEVAHISDHRFFRLVKEALEGRKLRKVKENMKNKKVSPNPIRVQKPGTGNEGPTQSKKIRELKEKAKQSGRMADLMRLIEALN